MEIVQYPSHGTKILFTSGETREFVTYYGLSELEQNLIPPLALSVYADNKVSISNFNDDDINANVYLDNIEMAMRQMYR